MKFLYLNQAYILLGISSLVIILTGVAISSHSPPSIKILQDYIARKSNQASKLLNTITSIQPMKSVKQSIKSSLLITLYEDTHINILSSLISITVTLLSILCVFIIQGITLLWYVKALMILMGIVLPHYVTTLMLDLYKYSIGKAIPKLIDEFRSAFIRHNKIRPALRECSLYVDKGLGRILVRASDSTFVEANLETLKVKLDNVWFNIFVILLSNFKENGGELIDQLYRLNRTMTRYTTIEKKKNKRLIWYEVFAICASVFSIPAIFALNSIILGNDPGLYMDAKTSMMISQVIGYSILSLVIIRILRRI